MEASTAVCRNCGDRFPISRHSNRYGSASRSRIKSSRFCSAKCKQAAYRSRNTERANNGISDASATTLLRAVTQPLQTIENTAEIRASKTVLGQEIYARHGWEDRVSSGGVAIKVAQLGRPVLVRRESPQIR
jgi:hypothetical protein